MAVTPPVALSALAWNDLGCKVGGVVLLHSLRRSLAAASGDRDVIWMGPFADGQDAKRGG